MALDPRSPFSSAHPLAGKITAGVRTTENRARLPHQSMQLAEMPTITMADRAQQMFSMTDTKGTRVYYSNQGVFNTVDEMGKSINFIQGLFKTNNLKVIRFLQFFVEGGHIHYLELKEDPDDAITSDEQTRESARPSNWLTYQSTACIHRLVSRPSRQRMKWQKRMAPK